MIDKNSPSQEFRNKYINDNRVKKWIDLVYESKELTKHKEFMRQELLFHQILSMNLYLYKGIMKDK